MALTILRGDLIITSESLVADGSGTFMDISNHILIVVKSTAKSKREKKCGTRDSGLHWGSLMRHSVAYSFS